MSTHPYHPQCVCCGLLKYTTCDYYGRIKQGVYVSESFFSLITFFFYSKLRKLYRIRTSIAYNTICLPSSQLCITICCLRFTKPFRKIRLDNKWNTTFWPVPAENFREQRNILQGGPVFPDGIFKWFHFFKPWYIFDTSFKPLRPLFWDAPCKKNWFVQIRRLSPADRRVCVSSNDARSLWESSLGSISF